MAATQHLKCLVYIIYILKFQPKCQIKCFPYMDYHIQCMDQVVDPREITYH
jgi:hypothetical protein